MKASNLFALILAGVVLAGCSSMSLEGKRVDYKAAAVKSPSLEVPPDLTVPGADERYAIPGNAEEGVASYSDFTKGGETAPSKATATVLPESKVVRMERNGAQHWLVAEDKAEVLWPQIKAFWLENGFVIKVDNPQAGVMETDWAENRAKIPRGGLRSILGKVVDGIYDSGELDRYRVRLERSKDGKSTEIYLTQYGKEEVLSEDKSTSKWQSRPNDPELETAMLQMLMAKLGGGAATEQATGQEASTAASAPVLKSLDDGRKVIQFATSFDKSWRETGLALDRAGIVVEDKNRAAGTYFVRVTEAAKEQSWLDKLAFWRSDDSAQPVRYQVTVHETASGCEVSAMGEKGEAGPAAQWIIDTLFKSLGK